MLPNKSKHVSTVLFHECLTCYSVSSTHLVDDFSDAFFLAKLDNPAPHGHTSAPPAILYVQPSSPSGPIYCKFAKYTARALYRALSALIKSRLQTVGISARSTRAGHCICKNLKAASS